MQARTIFEALFLTDADRRRAGVEVELDGCRASVTGFCWDEERRRWVAQATSERR